LPLEELGEQVPTIFDWLPVQTPTVKLEQATKTRNKIIVVGYSLGANNSTYVAKNVKHVDELIAIQASVWEKLENTLIKLFK
jgi:hypothetical protein